MRGAHRVGLWLVIVAGAIWVVARTTFVAELAAFLPRPETPGQVLLLSQLSDGIASRLVLMGIEGDTPERMVAISRQLAASLRQSGRFRYVANGSAEFPRAEREALLALRYHLSPAVTSERFSVAGLREALAERLQALASPLGALVRPILPRDPTGELFALLGTQADRIQPPMREGVWFDEGQARAMLLVEADMPGYDAPAQRALQAFIEAAFVQARGDSAARLMLTGPSVFALKTQEAIERDAWRLTAISALLVALILWSAYRSASLTLLAFLPVLSGLVTAIAAVGLVFGSCHVITIGFGATLIGEAVDYPTYLFAQRRRGEPVAEVARRIGPTLRVAVLTTALGSLGLLASSFVGIAQLGLFTMVGVATAGWVTRYVLPVMAPAPARLMPLAGDHAGGALTRLVGALSGFALVVPLVLSLAAVYLGVHHARIWERDLEKLSPISDADKRLDQQLREMMGAPDVRYLVVVRGPNADAVLGTFESLHGRLDALRTGGAMGAYDSPARYLPSAARQRERLAALPASAELRVRLASALEGTPFQEGSFEPFLAEVEQARTAPVVAARDLERTAWGVGLRSLLFQSGADWIGLAPLSIVRDAGRIAREIAAHNDAAVSLFDFKVESDSMVAVHGWRSVVLGIGGLLLIALVLAIAQRGAGRAARILLPVITAIVCAAAITVMAGTPLSFLHVVSLVMVLGTGVNYALFFAQADACDPVERNRAAFSVAVASGTTLCGFGVLAFADTPILRTVGITVVVGAGLAFLLSAAWAPGQRAAR